MPTLSLFLIEQLPPPYDAAVNPQFVAAFPP